MKNLSQISIACLASVFLITTTSGCFLFHELQPHRLWRWNRQPPPSIDRNFSVSDPIPELDQNINH
ncbi:MAG: hypothetical protein CMJ78_18330 [Planctomycetaceae bacterium]|nr:hypothetical protein [Planctomycetaceae bacterium]